MRIPIAKEGYPFIAIALVLFVGAHLIFGFSAIAGVFSALLILVVNFFRDPERIIPQGDDIVVSPADGRVIRIEKVKDERFTGEERILVSIFMNVFNVHVQRSPVTGTVKKVQYNKGKFINASFEKASLDNEQNAIILEDKRGRTLVSNQIAGLVARRIICYVKENDQLQMGERYGIIRFGSRLDVYLPLDAEVQVKIGDKPRAGSTIIAKW